MRFKDFRYFVFAAALAAVLPCGAVFAAPMGSKTVSASDVAEAEAAAKAASQKKQQLDRKAEEIKSELKNVNKKMIEAARRIQNGEDEVQKKQAELEELQKHLSASEVKFDAEHEMLKETLAALQNLALRPSEAVLAQPLSPVEVMRSSILLRGSIRSLKERAEIIRHGIEDISSQKAEIDRHLKDLEKENKQLAEQQAEMRRMSQQKKKMYAQVSTQSKEAEQRAATLASQAGSLRELLEKLEKQKALQQRQLAEKQRLARERAADKVRADKGLAPAETAPAAGTEFAKAKGRLARPARGPVLTAFHQEMSKGVISNGIDIKTVSGAQVVAPYDGTVIFAGPFKNFANLLIIDHGDGYTSLLSGLAETDAKVGQTLLAGEPVGNMPSGGNARLHMEIRKNNHPLNPVEWMSK